MLEDQGQYNLEVVMVEEVISHKSARGDHQVLLPILTITEENNQLEQLTQEAREESSSLIEPRLKRTTSLTVFS